MGSFWSRKNIFRGYIAGLQEDLLNKGAADRGIIAAETFDYDIIDKIYKPHESMTLMVTLLPDGNTKPCNPQVLQTELRQIQLMRQSMAD